MIGKFKDELNGRVMYEHVGLRSKNYASRSEVDPNNKEKSEFIKKSKGVKKSVVEHEIKFEDYVECLRQNKELLHTMNTIRSYNHNLYSVELNKISLSPHDNKRYIYRGDIMQYHRIRHRTWKLTLLLKQRKKMVGLGLGRLGVCMYSLSLIVYDSLQ